MVCPDLAECDTVVEAAFEDLEVKHGLFRELEAAVSPDCILASNTSSIPLASIARVCEHRGRVAGLHFFNPVPLMKLVEVIRAAQTSDETVANLMAAGPAHDAHAGRGQGQPRVPGKHGRAGLHHRGQPDCPRGRGDTRTGRRDHARLLGVSDGSLRADGPDRHRRELSRVSQIIYRRLQSRIPRLKTSANHMAMFDAGLLRTQDRAGMVRL